MRSGSLTGVAASRKARKIFASPSEIWNSGCHCTPMQKRYCGASMPSITPSGRGGVDDDAVAAHRPPPGDGRCSPPARRRRRSGAAGCRGATFTVWPGSLRGLGCSCASASATESGMCWISLPPSTTCSSCWPPQMPSTGLFCGQRALGDAELEGGAAVLGDHGRVLRAAAVVGRVDVERAAGHDQRVDPLEIVGDPVGLVRQRHRQATRRVDRVEVVLAQRIPGKLRVPAGLFSIQRDSDQGARHGGRYHVARASDGAPRGYVTVENCVLSAATDLRLRPGTPGVDATDSAQDDCVRARLAASYDDDTMFRGTSLNGLSVSTLVSCGIFSTRSEMMLRWISSVPPAIERGRHRDQDLRDHAVHRAVLAGQHRIGAGESACAPAPPRARRGWRPACRASPRDPAACPAPAPRARAARSIRPPST